MSRSSAGEAVITFVFRYGFGAVVISVPLSALTGPGSGFGPKVPIENQPGAAQNSDEYVDDVLRVTSAASDETTDDCDCSCASAISIAVNSRRS